MGEVTMTPLEALENIKKLFIGSPIDLSQQLDIIEQALKRLKVYEDYQIDLTQEDEIEKLLELNGKITYIDKVLDTQERLVKSVSSDEIRILSSVFKSQLAKMRKKLKALKIIKEKGNFISLEYDEYHDKYYIYDNELYMHNEITKEEYDLLKELLL